MSGDTNKQHVLEALYAVREEKRSVSAMSVGVREIQQKAREFFGLKQKEVAHALDYLVRHGWVEEIQEQRTVARGKMTIPTTQTKYRLSDDGLSWFERGSNFDRSSRYQGINIENVSGVVVLGNNNVVNNKFRDLFTNIDELERLIKLSDQLNEEQKLGATADLQTAKDQLSKDQPSGSILETALAGVRGAADTAGALDLFERVQQMVTNILF